MSKTKHTPGPWTAKDELGQYLLDSPWGIENEDSRYYGCAPVHAGGMVVALAVFSQEEDQPEDANARLIAAAPDLLKALQAIVQRYEFDGIPNDSLPFVDVARAAIAKATGGAE